MTGHDEGLAFDTWYVSSWPLTAETWPEAMVRTWRDYALYCLIRESEALGLYESERN